MTKKIIIHLHTGYCGTESDEGWIVPADIDEKELDDHCYSLAVDNAERYGIYPLDQYADCEEVSDEELDSSEYSDNIEGSWELYDEAKHRGKITYGNHTGPNWNIY